MAAASSSCAVPFVSFVATRDTKPHGTAPAGTTPGVAHLPSSLRESLYAHAALQPAQVARERPALPTPAAYAAMNEAEVDALLQTLSDACNYRWRAAFRAQTTERFVTYVEGSVPLNQIATGDSVVDAAHEICAVDGTSFFGALQTAFSDDLSLDMRPDDVLGAIVAQLAIHIYENTDALRVQGVLPGKPGDAKEMITVRTTNDAAPIAEMIARIAQEEIPKRLPGAAGALHAFLRTFTTTTTDDAVMRGAYLMGAMQKLFAYHMFTTCCGIRRVTMRGTADDWRALRDVVGALHVFEVKDQARMDRWAVLLYPVLDKFVESYERAARGEQVDLDFWDCAGRTHSTDGSGASTWWTGWQTAFMVYAASYGSGKVSWVGDMADEKTSTRLAGVLYPTVKCAYSAPPSMLVPVKWTDEKTQSVHDCVLVAGCGLVDVRRDGDAVTLAARSDWCMLTSERAAEQLGRPQARISIGKPRTRD